MKIVFISNALDHIQIPLCDAFFAYLNNDFHYIATSQSSGIRSDITSEDINKSRPYVICPYESLNQKIEAERIILEADAAILGTAPESYIKERLNNNHLTFRYMERLYKTPFNIQNLFRRVISAYIHHTRFQKKELYLLCAGAYAAYDHELYRNYREKRYTWGYFPAIREKTIEDLRALKKKNQNVELIWVGRFVELKHPEHVIYLAEYLKTHKYRFHINMIGYGELLEKCKEYVKEKELIEVDVLGPKNPSDVRNYMDNADILLFTSDRQEGWGAVVNEGMDSLCAVVASSAAGVSPFMVADGKNGYLYDCENQSSLNRKVENLIVDQELRLKMATEGYATVHKIWNPDNAAKSFIQLTESINKHIDNPIQNGPCSPAPIIKDGWYHDE